MNIEKMNEQEKSIALAKLCGWWITAENYLVMDDTIAKMRGGWSMKMENPVPMPNLYESQNMALAWYVLRWAAWNPNKIDDRKSKTNFFGYMNFGHLCQEKLENYFMLFLPQDEAQHSWLDKILELAIEVGMVTDD